MKIKSVQMIEVADWDVLVSSTYNRPYCFQQQDGCRDRGTVRLTVPYESEGIDFMNESIPEVVNGDQNGVKFAAWLARDPKQPLPNQRYDWYLDLWWTRSFYPSLQMVANDLHKRGLLATGSYVIEIDW